MNILEAILTSQEVLVLAYFVFHKPVRIIYHEAHVGNAKAISSSVLYHYEPFQKFNIME